MSASLDGNGPVPREPAPGDCPLSAREQTRNLVIFAINKSLVYLAAPVLYVGLVQAALCESLAASKTVANLPAGVYFGLTPLPIVAAWYFCAVRTLKPVLVIGYLIVSLSGLAVLFFLFLPTPFWLVPTLDSLHMPPEWVIPAVIVHAAVFGGAAYVIEAFQWEVISRGVSAKRRGQAFALAFGAGPVLAMIGSLASQFVIAGKLGPLEMQKLDYPWNFAILFGATGLIAVIPAVLSTLYTVPYPAVEVARQPFGIGVFGGFGDFLRHRLILITAIGYILIACGFNIMPNMTLFTKAATGFDAKEYVGYQNAARFGMKALAGLFLGWLLMRASPKACLLATAAFCLAGVLWVLNVRGEWFLLSFGLMGAGELNGVYYPNYIVCCSEKAKVRRNVAISSIMNMPSGLAAVLFGFLADRYGLPSSFQAALLVFLATLFLVQFLLPAHPPAPKEA